eukprot:364515-Chlamydomonas_euryale.AAC.16
MRAGQMPAYKKVGRLRAPADACGRLWMRAGQIAPEDGKVNGECKWGEKKGGRGGLRRAGWEVAARPPTLAGVGARLTPVMEQCEIPVIRYPHTIISTLVPPSAHAHTHTCQRAISSCHCSSGARRNVPSSGASRSSG